MTQDQDIQEATQRLRDAFDTAAEAIVDGQKSLCARMVRAYRVEALNDTQAEYIFKELQKAVEDCRATYTAAIAQPAPRVSTKSRITL